MNEIGVGEQRARFEAEMHGMAGRQADAARVRATTTGMAQRSASATEQRHGVGGAGWR